MICSKKFSRRVWARVDDNRGFVLWNITHSLTSEPTDHMLILNLCLSLDFPFLGGRFHILILLSKGLEITNKVKGEIKLFLVILEFQETFIGFLRVGVPGCLGWVALTVLDVILKHSSRRKWVQTIITNR